MCLNSSGKHKFIIYYTSSGRIRKGVDSNPRGEFIVDVKFLSTVPDRGEKVRFPENLFRMKILQKCLRFDTVINCKINSVTLVSESNFFNRT